MNDNKGQITHYDNSMRVEMIQGLQRLIDEISAKYKVSKDDVFKEIKHTYMFNGEVSKL